MAFAFLSWISSGVVAQGIENKGADNKGTEKKDVNKKWELGLGLGSLYGPDYRGADEYRSYTAAIPYVIYRGKYIRSDREGVRGNFFHSDNLEFSLSASANVTPDADKNKARTGMPKLGSTAELGPSFNIRLTGPSLRQGSCNCPGARSSLWVMTTPAIWVRCFSRSCSTVSAWPIGT